MRDEFDVIALLLALGVIAWFVARNRRTGGLPAQTSSAVSEDALRRLFPEPSYHLRRVEVSEHAAWLEFRVSPPPAEAGPSRTGGRASMQPGRTTALVNGEYKTALAESVRRVATMAFRRMAALDRVTISVARLMMDPLTGIDRIKCILSVEIDRATFHSIVHERVTAENALRNFPLRLSYGSDLELRPVEPFPPRHESDSSLSHRGALSVMDPLAFEELVRRLLERMGFEARLTKASHDGGVDIEAEDTRPIVGGRLLVQCKRYAGVVGSPVVRDLYGAVTDAHANKGILITTSHFSPDARQFAQGKPLELIDGEQLEALLSQHNL